MYENILRTFEMKHSTHFFLLFALAFLFGACSQPSSPTIKKRSQSIEVKNGNLSPELRQRLENAPYLDQEKFDLVGAPAFSQSFAIATIDDEEFVCSSLYFSSLTGFACPCGSFPVYDGEFDIFLVEAASGEPYRMFKQPVAAAGELYGELTSNLFFDEDFVGFFPEDDQLCDPVELPIDIEPTPPATPAYSESGPNLAPGYSDHKKVIRDLSGELLKFSSLAEAKDECDELSYCHRVWEVNGNYVVGPSDDRIIYRPGEYFLVRAGVSPTNVSPVTAGRFHTKTSFTDVEHLIPTNNNHQFFTHGPLSPLDETSLSLTSNTHQKYDYKVSNEVGNPRFVEGFGAIKLFGGSHKFFYWYSDGTYTEDSDKDHATQSRKNYAIDASLNVDPKDIVAMAVLGKGDTPLIERVLTVFADGDSYFYSVGTPSDLSKYTGSRKIPIQVPRDTKIVGASAHTHGLVEVRFYLNNYKYVTTTKGYLGTSIEDPRDQGNFELDFSNASQTEFSLIDGKSITDIVSIGGIDRKNIYIMYYDEVSEDLSGDHQFVAADFDIFVQSADGNADPQFLGTIQSSSIDQNNLKTTFKDFNFSSIGSNVVIDNTELALLDIWNGTKGNMTPFEKCISDSAGIATDLIDIVLDLFDVVIKDEQFWRGIEVGFPSNLGEEEKIAEAAKATLGKFFGPIKKINDGRVLFNKGEERIKAAALIAEGFILLVQKGYNYIVAGVKEFFSSWESWVKFGAALLLAAAEAETTGGTFLMLKVADVFLDLVNLGRDIPSLITDCESIHNNLELEENE